MWRSAGGPGPTARGRWLEYQSLNKSREDQRQHQKAPRWLCAPRRAQQAAGGAPICCDAVVDTMAEVTEFQTYFGSACQPAWPPAELLSEVDEVAGGRSFMCVRVCVYLWLYSRVWARAWAER